MWILVKGKKATEISSKVVNQLLMMYPEENLLNRPVFVDAFDNDSIMLNTLKEECEKLLIPWQMMLLDEKNLKKHIQHIEQQRKYKISNKLLAKRKGSGDVTSRRIVDRLIRLQNFLTEDSNLAKNEFASALSQLSISDAANKILNHFEIDREKLWARPTKTKALEYLIKQIEARNINISRGVLVHKLLPMHQVVSGDVYKNTSGFIIQDEKIPFIFLPSEISNEFEGRQIYTLIYLLVIIGLNKFDYYLEKNFTYKKLRRNSPEFLFHSITSELLMPSLELDKYRRGQITTAIRDELSQKLKVTPTALVYNLKLRKIITQEEYEELKPDDYQPDGKNKGVKRNSKVSTAIKKFCGELCYDAIRTAVQTQTLVPTQLQYLIYGGINKKGFKEFRAEIGV